MHYPHFKNGFTLLKLFSICARGMNDCSPKGSLVSLYLCWCPSQPILFLPSFFLPSFLPPSLLPSLPPSLPSPFFFYCLFIYSYVYTLFGPSLPSAPLPLPLSFFHAINIEWLLRVLLWVTDSSFPQPSGPTYGFFSSLQSQTSLEAGLPFLTFSIFLPFIHFTPHFSAFWPLPPLSSQSNCSKMAIVLRLARSGGSHL
jgi:hypothetical protein